MTEPKRSCFVAMPLTVADDELKLYSDDSEHYFHVLDYLFAPAVEQAGFELLRPAMKGADLIHAEIIKRLEQADLVLCDITKHNPNVFFELGIRTALDRPVALVRDQFTDRLPFDTSGINTHMYDPALSPWTLNAEIEKLAGHLRASVESSKGRNPLWRYFGLTRRADPELGDDVDPTDAKLDLILSMVQQGRTVDPPISPPSERLVRRYGIDWIPLIADPRFDAEMGDLAPLLRSLAGIAMAEGARLSFHTFEERSEHSTLTLNVEPITVSKRTVDLLIRRAAQDGVSLQLRRRDREPSTRLLRSS